MSFRSSVPTKILTSDNVNISNAICIKATAIILTNKIRYIGVTRLQNIRLGTQILG